MVANVPWLCEVWGFLLLLPTNIPKSCKKKAQFTTESANTSSSRYTPKPKFRKTAVVRRSLINLDDICGKNNALMTLLFQKYNDSSKTI